jgi:hypothetical protein
MNNAFICDVIRSPLGRYGNGNGAHLITTALDQLERTTGRA